MQSQPLFKVSGSLIRWMHSAGLGLLLASALIAPVAAAQTQAAADSQTTATAQKIVYSLPPGKLQKAHALYLQTRRFILLDPLYEMLALLGLLYFAVVARFRRLAESISPRKWLQGLIVLPLFAVTDSVLTIPIDVYHHYIGRAYGLSIQSWGSWWGDWAKTLLIAVIVETLLLLLLYAMIRRSPRRWWFYGWLICIPVVIFIFFISPVVIEPMFYKFTPLEQTNPELVAQLERVVKRGGLSIPPSRMYSMNASAKFTGDNAYVSGFGSSKHVVVWDTTQKHMTNPEIMFVFGHEMGHYVLGHVMKGIVAALAMMLLFLYLAYLCCGWMLRRWGERWRIREIGDWASVPMLALLISIFSFVSTPMQNAVSRYLEHQADTYGLEVIHGLVPNSGRVAAQSFQILGENWLDYPDVGRFVAWWAWDHPPTKERVEYAQDYDPWAEGKEPEFVKASNSP